MGPKTCAPGIVVSPAYANAGYWVMNNLAIKNALSLIFWGRFVSVRKRPSDASTTDLDQEADIASGAPWLRDNPRSFCNLCWRHHGSCERAANTPLTPEESIQIRPFRWCSWIDATRSASSLPRDSFYLNHRVKVMIITQDRKAVFQRQGCDPDIILRDGVPARFNWCLIAT